MKRGAPDHWKMADLAKRLHVPARYGVAWANGTLERLWHYAAKYHPQGDVGAAPNWAIAEACAWPARDADVLVAALISSRWLTVDQRHRLLVHDWPDHADESVKRTLKNRGLQFFFPEISEYQSGKCVSGDRLEREGYGNGSGKATEKAEPKTSEAWDRFISLYPRKTNLDSACRNFVSFVDLTNETEVFACLANYLESKDVADGTIMNPDKWLEQQHRDKWKARWPARAAPANGNGKQSKQERDAQAAQEAFDRGMAERRERENGKNLR